MIKKKSLAALMAAPLLLAACVVTEPTGTAGPKPVVVTPGGSASPVVVPPAGAGGGTTVVVPKPTTPGTPVVVGPTTVVSTDLAALAGSYDRSPTACRAAAGESRVTISPALVTLGAKQCAVNETARDGSGLRFKLACTVGASAQATEIVITRAAQGITLRQPVVGPQSLVKCGA